MRLDTGATILDEAPQREIDAQEWISCPWSRFSQEPPLALLAHPDYRRGGGAKGDVTLVLCSTQTKEMSVADLDHGSFLDGSRRRRPVWSRRSMKPAGKVRSTGGGRDGAADIGAISRREQPARSLGSDNGSSRSRPRTAAGGPPAGPESTVGRISREISSVSWAGRGIDPHELFAPADLSRCVYQFRSRQRSRSLPNGWTRINHETSIRCGSIEKRLSDSAASAIMSSTRRNGRGSIRRVQSGAGDNDGGLHATTILSAAAAVAFARLARPSRRSRALANARRPQDRAVLTLAAARRMARRQGPQARSIVSPHRYSRPP